MVHPDILGVVRFLNREAGGINRPIMRIVGFIFNYGGQLFDCRVLLRSGDIINPGEKKDIAIKFLCPELIKPKLKVGAEFLLQDYRIVAKGKVKKIFKYTECA